VVDVYHVSWLGGEMLLKREYSNYIFETHLIIYEAENNPLWSFFPLLGTNDGLTGQYG
jgi:hypothetical protein